MEKLRLMLVDEKMNTVEFEVSKIQFQRLGLDLTKITKHNKKRDLNITITRYLDSFNENA